MCAGTKNRAWILLLSALMVVLLPGCSLGPETVLQPTIRLVDHLEGEGGGARARPCAVADDLRMTLGCPRKVEVFSRPRRIEGRPNLSVQVALPGGLERGTVILEPSLLEDRSVWVPGDIVGHPLPPIVLEGLHRRKKLTLPVAPDLLGLDKVTVRIEGVAVPKVLPSFRTREFALPENPVFQVSLAVAAVAARAGAAPTVFTVRAHGDFGTREVLKETIDPAAKSPKWFNHRVDLGPLAGRRVWFEFVSALAPGAGHKPTRFSLPLWGNPQILDSLPRARQRNIILVSLDTLRADFVGNTYQGRPLTPFLDARSAAGASFSSAISTYPSTTAAHASLFTSTYAAEHQTFNTSHALPDSLPTLPQILAKSGYETAAFTENGMLAAGTGFQRGFDDYYENRGVNVWDARGDSANTFQRGLRWIESHRDDKFFVFLHTYEVHMPYAPPADFDLFASRPRSEEEPEPLAARDSYAGEVVYVDSILRDLFDTLERLELAEESIVVVTSDHGEAFGEHGVIGHSRGVYDELLRVPLVFWAPGLIPPGIELEAQVSLVDLAPTILELVGIPAGGSLQGQSLARAILEEASVDEGVRWAEGPHQLLRAPDAGPEEHFIAARTKHYKWIGRVGDAEPIEVYDLVSDPDENANLIDDETLRRRGHQYLLEYQKIRARGAPTRKRSVDIDTKRKLEALGYLD